MLSPAFEMQYSARFTDTVGRDGRDEDDPAASLLQHPFRGKLRQEMRALEVHADQLVEAGFGGFDDIAPLALADAGVIDQQVEPFEARAGMADQRLAIGGGGDIAGEDVGAGFGLQAFGRVATSPVGSN